MSQLIPTVSQLLEAFSGCFRQEVFETFRLVVAAWVVCPGTRTLSGVWQATGLSGDCHHDRIYALFASAKWAWDEVGKVLLVALVERLVPDGVVHLAVDDTLCHKRGAKVAFGGFFLDPVASTKKYKNFRFGLNWVVLGLVVELPFRPDRYVCLPLLWRLFRKAGQPGHKPRTESAAEMARLVASWLPARQFRLVADGAYVNKVLLAGRPANLQLTGPVRLDAALYGVPEPRAEGTRGRPRKRGDRLPTPKAALADTAAYPAAEVEVVLPGGPKAVRTQVVRDVMWYAGAGTELVTVVLVRDPSGAWPDTALLATGPGATAASAIGDYCRRWSVEVAFRDSKQWLGLHEPHVRSAESVERAHPMAWFVQSLTVLWYAAGGKDAEKVERARPWYRRKPAHTFTDMLGALRLQLWGEKIKTMSENGAGEPEIIKMLTHKLAAVG